MSGTMKKEVWPPKCDECGKFVAYADLESGAALHTMHMPDSEFSAETWETLCAKCNTGLDNGGDAK